MSSNQTTGVIVDRFEETFPQVNQLIKLAADIPPEIQEYFYKGAVVRIRNRHNPPASPGCEGPEPTPTNVLYTLRAVIDVQVIEGTGEVLDQEKFHHQILSAIPHGSPGAHVYKDKDIVYLLDEFKYPAKASVGVFRKGTLFLIVGAAETSTGREFEQNKSVQTAWYHLEKTKTVTKQQFINGTGFHHRRAFHPEF